MVSKLLQTIVRSLFPNSPGLVSAFGYGSVAVPQHGRATANSQLDLILVVDNPLEWHISNLQRNFKHYSGFASFDNGRLLKSAVVSWPRPAVYYNPLVTWEDPTDTFPPQVIKYGVVGFENLKHDLETWSDLYVAGRLHKPVVYIPQYEPPSKLRSPMCTNLKSALAFSLLILDMPLLKEDTLYHSLASISYRGDWRLYFGEDRRKIERLIMGAPRRRGFRDLYVPLFGSEPFKSLYHLEVPNDLATDLCILPKKSDESIRRLVECLPLELCHRAVGYDAASCRERLTLMDTEERRKRLLDASASIVCSASYRQTVLGLFSAGLLRSFTYSLAKFRKMLASIGC